MNYSFLRFNSLNLLIVLRFGRTSSQPIICGRLLCVLQQRFRLSECSVNLINNATFFLKKAKNWHGLQVHRGGVVGPQRAHRATRGRPPRPRALRWKETIKTQEARNLLLFCQIWQTSIMKYFFQKSCSEGLSRGRDRERDRDRDRAAYEVRRSRGCGALVS